MGRFKLGHKIKFNKICTKCTKDFIANSGSQKKCELCRDSIYCLECNKHLPKSYHKFCNNSCAGKWKWKNNPNYNQFEQARQLAYTPETREKIRKAQEGKPKYHLRGENNPNWKGGTYGTERHTLMGRVEYKNWRKAVFERDNYTCQHCNKRGGDLEADHIIPYYINKDIVLDLNNGRTLCKSCHMETDSWGHKVKTQYKLKEAS